MVRHERRIANDGGAAVDAEGVVAAGDERDQPDMRVEEDVVEAVGPPALPGRPGIRDGRVIEHRDQVGRIALGRDIEVALVVGGGHEEKDAAANQSRSIG